MEEKRTYYTTRRKADQMGISEARVRWYLLMGRFKGAMKPGRDWLIPADEDPRKPVGRPKTKKGVN